MPMKAILVATMIIAAIQTSGYARTWRVNPHGTGDAPDLHAAMDSANAYDTVLLEAGLYSVPGGLSVTMNVNLVGESGPAFTLIYRDDPLASSTVGLLSGASITGIHIRGNTNPVLYSHSSALADHCIIESLNNILLVQGYPGIPQFRNCLLLGGEVGVRADFISCIIFSDLGSYAVGSTLFSCDVLGYVHPSIDASISNANFSLDPQFCGLPGSGNYFLKSTSPCLPGNSPYGAPDLTGPLGVGCGTVAVESRTWGAVKALYR
jgi:hypothetical protein